MSECENYPETGIITLPCSASKCVNVTPFHVDRLWILHVPSVPASVATTTIVSNNMTVIDVMLPTEREESQ